MSVEILGELMRRIDDSRDREDPEHRLAQVVGLACFLRETLTPDQIREFISHGMGVFGFPNGIQFRQQIGIDEEGYKALKLVLDDLNISFQSIPSSRDLRKS